MSSLQQGINAAKAGRMQEALGFLKDAIIEEPQNADVWVWVAAIIDDLDKQEIFLEKALEIDPHNIPAQRGLAYPADFSLSQCEPLKTGNDKFRLDEVEPG